jgi:hypothetical protein
MEIDNNEKKLYDLFLKYKKQWIRLFFTDIDSVKIHKNPDTKKLEVWEWAEKEKLSTL